MVAYAAVASLMGTMHLLSQSSLNLQEGNKEHLESLYDKVGSLLEFLDNSDNELMKDLQKKVKDLANEVEDEVESQALLIMEKDEHIRTEANERHLIILQQAIPDIDYVKEELSKQRKNNKLQAGNGSVGGTCSPQSDVSTIDNNVVGYNVEQEVMLRQLTGDSFQMEVISIVGMGGIVVPQDHRWVSVHSDQDSRYSITVQLPNGIWKMSQLRHLHCRSIYFLSSPPNKYRVLENLRSVSGLNPSCCTKEIFEGIKKAKQLGISNLPCSNKQNKHSSKK
ncbi:hypothetical protein KY290_035140 [Solanum tuberosum]|uniref:Uncharacterized protein n=1 Tax=Solanum tuberosum TaxID=4113 RepID=A0ABQ7U735_SOLTU|nr:hypothetical protein KY285_032507 [Solanum tuberosum]KAH0742097.1 hypothetical protein KY290_035140 [Solanum tuberosum]